MTLGNLFSTLNSHNIPDNYRRDDLLVQLIWGNKDELSYNWANVNSPKESNIEIIWQFTKDALKKEDILWGKKLYIFVYAKNNKPKVTSKTTYGMAVGILGLVGLGYCISLQSQSSNDYAIYKSKTNENDPVYSTLNREGYYARANDKHIQSQIIGGSGLVLAAIGTICWIKFNKQNKLAKNVIEKGHLNSNSKYKTGYLPDRKRFIVEPLIGSGNDLGLGIRIKY